MRSSPRKMLDVFYLKIEEFYRAHCRVKTVKRRLKAMNGGCKEKDDIYKSQILPYWKKYGVKPSKIWHRLYGKPGVPYDVRYIPDNLWYSHILPHFSNMFFRRALEDKCLHNVQFPNVNRPVTVLKNIAGLFYDDDINLMTEEQAIDILAKAEGDLIVKPSIDSGEARLIQFVKAPLTKEQSLKLFNDFGANFIAQKTLTQHPDLAQFNPQSINTLRVISFLFNNKVHFISHAIRIGAAGSRVDNSAKGGYMCRIDPDGQLGELAYDNDRHSYAQVGNAKPFAQVKVPYFDRVLKVIEEEHPKRPHFKIIGWDFTVTPEGEPVMIEYNVCPGGNQMVCGPAFGDLTEQVLDEVFITKKFAASQN